MDSASAPKTSATLLADDSSGPDAERLASHVQHCTRCQQRLEEMTAAANRPADGSPAAQGTKATDEYELTYESSAETSLIAEGHDPAVDVAQHVGMQPMLGGVRVQPDIEPGGVEQPKIAAR